MCGSCSVCSQPLPGTTPTLVCGCLCGCDCFLPTLCLPCHLTAPPPGYCQGLNLLAAFLLLYLDEQDVFWGLLALVEDVMQWEYYRFPMLGSHIDLRIFSGEGGQSPNWSLTYSAIPHLIHASGWSRVSLTFPCFLRPSQCHPSRAGCPLPSAAVRPQSDVLLLVLRCLCQHAACGLRHAHLGCLPR